MSNYVKKWMDNSLTVEGHAPKWADERAPNRVFQKWS
jgi:hypothetical protein